ncbi:MAG TPA: ABC transporter substrate-binding protein, partial [Gaiellaceae bacterium]|nr:ABC transporter substrate-binding protein [Gaiellaceae bacterium]
MSRPPGSGQALRALLCASIILVAASAAGGTAIGAPTAATQLTPVEIGAITAEPAALAFYAKDMGFFERQGIDARLNILLDPTQTVPAVVAGQIRFAAFPTAMLALAKSRGAPFKLVAAGALYRPKAPTTALVSAPGGRIRTAQDLVGKRVAVDSLNTIAHVGLLRWLKRGGVSADKVRLSTMPFSQMLGPILRGQVAAAVLPEPYVTQTTARGARRVAPILDAVCTADCLLTIW